MTDIPDDIKATARLTLAHLLGARNYAHEAEIIARAILAERERCAKIADDWPSMDAPAKDRIAAAIRGKR